MKGGGGDSASIKRLRCQYGFKSNKALPKQQSLEAEVNYGGKKSNVRTT